VGLKEAKDAVEALMRVHRCHRGNRVKCRLRLKSSHFSKGVRRFAAIKLYRDRTGVGLKEAKDFVEALAADRRIAASSRSGCLGVILLSLRFADGRRQIVCCRRP